LAFSWLKFGIVSLIGLIDVEKSIFFIYRYQGVLYIMSRDFRSLLLKTYRRCPLSNLDPLECDGAHLIPQSVCYKLSLGELAKNPINGIILSKSLHSSFDRNLWCLDPYDIIWESNQSHSSSQQKFCSLPVIVKKNRLNFSINQYEGKRIQIPIDSLPFIWIRYQLFIGRNYEIHTNYNELEFFRKHISSIQYIQLVKNPTLLHDWLLKGGPGGLRDNRRRFASHPDLKKEKQIHCLLDHQNHNHTFLALFHYKPWKDSIWIKGDKIPENLVRQYQVLCEKSGDPDW